jgi:Transcription factor zinc-finger
MNRTEAAEKQWIDREEADRAQERKWAQQCESAKASPPPEDRFCERPLICPHCTKLLELRNVSGVELHGCNACAGGWLEADQLAALMKKRLG